MRHKALIRNIVLVVAPLLFVGCGGGSTSPSVSPTPKPSSNDGSATVNGKACETCLTDSNCAAGFTCRNFNGRPFLCSYTSGTTSCTSNGKFCILTPIGGGYYQTQCQ